MSDTLADLASWLPSEFLTADHIPINKTHLLNNHHNSHPYPYEFGSSSSTESESDDDDHLAGLTYRFTRSVSLQERLKIAYPIQKRVFSSSPESAFNWNVSRPTHVRSSPATPLVHSDEDSWERIYAAAAGQIARMKMNMNMNLNIINANDGVFSNRNFLRDPRPHIAPLPSHYNHPNCSLRMCANEEFFRQQQFHHTVNYSSCGGWRGTNRPVWQPQVENPRLQQPANAFFVKPVVAGSGSAGVKKECAGTGVFLPRTSYSDAPHESQKKPACSGSHLPARVQSFNKTMDPINPQPQPNIYSGFSPHNQVPPHHFNGAELAEIVMARRHAEMLAQQRRSTKETQIGGHPEVVLPQEWSY